MPMALSGYYEKKKGIQPQMDSGSSVSECFDNDVFDKGGNLSTAEQAKTESTSFAEKVSQKDVQLRVSLWMNHLRP